eukprot:10877995-Ditylum_brightwellii.AAC.1
MEDKATRKGKPPPEKENAPNKKRPKQKKLSWEARLNIRADALSTHAYHVLCKRKKNKATFHPLPAAKIYLQIQDTFVLSRYQDAINDVWYYEDLEKHLSQKYTWSKSTMAGIDFNTPGAIYKNSTVNYKSFLTQLVYNWFPVREADYSMFYTQECPLCKAPKETMHHFMDCDNNKESWMSLSTTFTPVFDQFNIDPVLQVLIDMGLTNGNIQDTKEKHPKLP